MLWNEGPLGPLETVFFNSMTLIFSSIFGNGRGTKGSHLSLTTDDRGMHSDYALHTLCQIKSILEADKRNHFMQKWPHGNGFFWNKKNRDAPLRSRPLTRVYQTKPFKSGCTLSCRPRPTTIEPEPSSQHPDGRKRRHMFSAHTKMRL